MDAGTIQAAIVGLKFIGESLRAIAGTRIDIAANGRVAEALEKLGQVQDAVFQLREVNASLQEENLALKARAREQDAWAAIEAKYTLTQTPGGAMVWSTDGPPPHYACPRCFDEHKRSILQDRRVAAGLYDCPACKREFGVGSPRQSMYGPMQF